MKKLILTIAAIAAMANISSAQDNETDFREDLKFGLKAGMNYSNVYSTEGEEFVADPKFGLAGGVFVAIPIGKYLGVQPEILFSQKGFQASGKLLGSPYEITRTSNYLDIPLYFSLKPSEFLTLQIGPQFSYLLSQKDKFTSGSSTIEQEQEFENDNIRRNMLCFAAGADINLKHVILGARVGWDLSKNNGDGTATTPRYKNVWYQGTIGYRF